MVAGYYYHYDLYSFYPVHSQSTWSFGKSGFKGKLMRVKRVYSFFLTVIVGIAFLGIVIHLKRNPNSFLSTLTQDYHTGMLLNEIVNSDDAKAADILEKSKIEPNLLNKQGDSILIWAISKNMQKSAATLLKMGANPNLPDSEGISPLMYAVLNRNPKTTCDLLKFKANLNQQDQKGRTPLFYAVQNQDTQCVELLLSKGADIHHEDQNGQTPLHAAVQWHAIDSVQLLVENHADIMALDQFGQSPLKLIELSPYYHNYMALTAIKEHLPVNYHDTLPTQTVSGEIPPDWDLERITLLVHRKVNDQRQSRDLDPLGYNEDLEYLALLHSRDMAINQFFAHENLKGESATDRALKIGLTVTRTIGSITYRGISENLYMSSLKKSVAFYVEKGIKIQNIRWHSNESAAQAIVDGWMNSTGHRKNMLNPNLIEQGIGIYITDQHKLYASQEMR
ncbi:MAG: hypothetical protein CSA81_06935 [Acidobacteria bacterium]|nr:MAG: hypothetical protein CSA81_06935 [Acidobacteriota bacterium]